MKRIFVASFFSIILMLVPITAIAQQSEIPKFEGDKPIIYITEEQLDLLNAYINLNFEGEEKALAENLRDKIIINLEVDIIQLTEAWEEHGFSKIPKYKLEEAQTVQDLMDLMNEYWFSNIFGNFIKEIINLIKDRLGWLYDFFYNGFSLFFEGLELITDFIEHSFALLVVFIGAVNYILTIPGVIAQALQDLFNLEFDKFVDSIIWLINTFADECIIVLNAAIILVQPFERLMTYLEDVKEYIQWLDNNPWTFPILVQGNVKNIFNRPIKNARITVKGQNVTTDENGDFSFFVEPNPDVESFPPNEFYGMHNCQITVEKNGKVLKETLRALSYSFSNGTVNWNFYLLTARSKAIIHRATIMERFANVLERIQTFLPIFNRRLGRIQAPSI